MLTELPAESIDAYGIRWMVMPDTYRPVTKFHPEEWKKINSSTPQDDEFRNYLNTFSLISRAYLLYKAEAEDEPIGFVWLIYDNYMRGSVMIHGGTWQAGKISTLLLYKGILALTEHLLTSGFRVHSQCHIENIRSLRFLRGCGFRPYEYDEDYVKLYITSREIAKSKVCRWIKQNISLQFKKREGMKGAFNVL